MSALHVVQRPSSRLLVVVFILLLASYIVITMYDAGRGICSPISVAVRPRLTAGLGSQLSLHKLISVSVHIGTGS